jgi:hypothetical protein
VIFGATQKGRTTNPPPLLLLMLDSGSRIRDPRSEIRNPRSEMDKNQDPGSRINIPDPQHCSGVLRQGNSWFVGSQSVVYLIGSIPLASLSAANPRPLRGWDQKPRQCCWSSHWNKESFTITQDFIIILTLSSWDMHIQKKMEQV